MQVRCSSAHYCIILSRTVNKNVSGFMLVFHVKTTYSTWQKLNMDTILISDENYIRQTGCINLCTCHLYFSAKIAGQLSDESCFGLIFGINTLIGTGLQSILTLVLIQTLKLPIASQYYTISGLYMLLASMWLLVWMVNIFKQKQNIQNDIQYS